MSLKPEIHTKQLYLYRYTPNSFFTSSLWSTITQASVVFVSIVSFVFLIKSSAGKFLFDYLNI